MPQRRQEMYLLHVLAKMLEQNKAPDIPENSVGNPGALPEQSCPALLIPDCPGIDIIVLAGEIDGQVKGEGGVGRRR